MYSPTAAPAKLGLLAVFVALGILAFFNSMPSGEVLPSSRGGRMRSLEAIADDDTSRKLALGHLHYTAKLRMAAFGSSNTWGAGLDNRFDAYPYQLSNKVDNFASFSGGPNFPSVCTETLVGDDKMYDVVLLEFWLKAGEGLNELSRRLNQRFPEADQIFLRLWAPFHARRKPDSSPLSGPILTFQEWKSQQNLQTGQLNELIDLLKQDNGHWYFIDHENADAIITETIKGLNGLGHRIHFPHDDTCKESLIHYLHYFDSDTHTRLSPLGHELVANLTSQIIHFHHKGTPEAAVRTVTDKTGHWGTGDSCHFWLLTGACKFQHSENFHMAQFDKVTEKHALQIDSEGWIDVENPFDNPRQVFMSFISTDTRDFPVVNVKFTGVGGAIASVNLDPDHALDVKHAGVTRTVSVGAVPGGTTTRITLSPRETAANPFLLVGISFTNEVAVPNEYGFGPSFNK